MENKTNNSSSMREETAQKLLAELQALNRKLTSHPIDELYKMSELSDLKITWKAGHSYHRQIVRKGILGFFVN